MLTAKISYNDFFAGVHYFSSISKGVAVHFKLKRVLLPMLLSSSEAEWRVLAGGPSSLAVLALPPALLLHEKACAQTKEGGGPQTIIITAVD